MESKENKYQLVQKNGSYVFSTSVQGDEVILTLKNTSNPASALRKNFSIETWRRIGAIFESVQTPSDVIQWIDKALKVHKVKVIEQGSDVRIVFFVVQDNIKHRVEIPLTGGEQATATINTSTSFNTSLNTASTANIIGQSTQTQYIQQSTASQAQYSQQYGATTTTATNFIQEIGIDPSKIVNQTVNDNTDAIIKSIEEEKKLRLSQTGKIISGSTQTQAKDTRSSYVPPYITPADEIPASAPVMTTEIKTEETPIDVNLGNYTQNYNYQETTTTQIQTSTTPEINTQYISTTNEVPVSAPVMTTEIKTEETPIDVNLGNYTQNYNYQETTTTQIQTSTTPEINTQYISTTNEVPVSAPVMTTEIKTEETPIDFNLGNYTQNYNYQETTTTQIQTSTTPEINTQYTETNTKDTRSSYMPPYITPADEIPTSAPVATTEIKTEETPIDINMENYTYNTEQFASTTELKGLDQNVHDERLGKLEGDTNTLKSENQLIQSKLTTLMSQVTSYKNQLELLEKEKQSNELSALRAENAAIKQQLSELNNLRREAAQVNLLRSQVSQLEPLRSKAAEMESLKGQLAELHALRAKVAELSGLESKLGELNNLKAQVGQMNLMRQQMDELSVLRAKVEELNKATMESNAQNEEKENLKRRLQELENLKAQYEQEIKTLKEQKTTTTTTTVEKSSGLEKNQLLFEDKAQQISVKGDIIHSTEELELITRKINKANKKITLNLLYKATVDSDKATAFHDKCDHAQSSLVLVETDKGKRFGGFTTCSWAGDCEEKKDEDAFVFSLDKMMIYENIPNEDAIGCYPKFGPIFLGCQIRIYDNAFSKGGTTFEKGLNYYTEEDYELTGGERCFNVKEIEVYEVIAQ